MRKLLLSAALCAVAFGAPTALASDDLAEGLIKAHNVQIQQDYQPSAWMQPITLSLAQLNEMIKGTHIRKFANGREYALSFSALNPALLTEFVDFVTKSNKAPTQVPEDVNNDNNAPKKEDATEVGFLLTPSLKPSFHTITYSKVKDLSRPNHNNDLEGKITDVRDYLCTYKDYQDNNFNNPDKPNTVIRETQEVFVETTTASMDWNLVWNLTSMNTLGVQLPMDLLVSEVFDESKLPTEPWTGNYIYPPAVPSWFIKAPVISDKKIETPVPNTTPKKVEQNHVAPAVQPTIPVIPKQNGAFNPDTYLQMNPDLAGHVAKEKMHLAAARAFATKHFNEHGKREGRKF